MSYFEYNPADHLRHLYALCKGKHILELGCADGALAALMLQNGAVSVIGIDTKATTTRNTPSSNFQLIPCQFTEEQATLPADLVVCSWPTNNPEAGIIPSIINKRPFILIGAMDMTTIVGHSSLWRFLTTLQINSHHAHGPYFITHYNDNTVIRQPLPCEAIGLELERWNA